MISKWTSIEHITTPSSIACPAHSIIIMSIDILTQSITNSLQFFLPAFFIFFSFVNDISGFFSQTLLFQNYDRRRRELARRDYVKFDEIIHQSSWRYSCEVGGVPTSVSVERYLLVVPRITGTTLSYHVPWLFPAALSDIRQSCSSYVWFRNLFRHAVRSSVMHT